MFFKGDKVAVLECLDIDEGLYLVRSSLFLSRA